MRDGKFDIRSVVSEGNVGGGPGAAGFVAGIVIIAFHDGVDHSCFFEPDSCVAHVERVDAYDIGVDVLLLVFCFVREGDFLYGARVGDSLEGEGIWCEWLVYFDCVITECGVGVVIVLEEVSSCVFDSEVLEASFECFFGIVILECSEEVYFLCRSVCEGCVLCWLDCVVEIRLRLGIGDGVEGEVCIAGHADDECVGFGGICEGASISAIIRKCECLSC